ncbi:MAG: metallophosphoesterase, partial [Actinocatenispora sp.]
MIFFAVAVALALIAAVHWYLWKRLVADVSRPGGWWRRLGTVLAVLLALLVPATLVGARALSPTGAGRVLAWPGYLWVALLLYLVLAVAVLEIPRAVGRRWTRVRRGAERPPVEPTGGAGRQTAVPAPARPSAPVPD